MFRRRAMALSPGSRSYYEVLGVAREATAEEIHRAYRRLARQYHPDVNATDDARVRFAEVSSAYEVLHDPAQRARYDRETAAVARRAGPTGRPVRTFTGQRPAREVPRFLDDEPRCPPLSERVRASEQRIVVWDLHVVARLPFGWPGPRAEVRWLR